MRLTFLLTRAEPDPEIGQPIDEDESGCPPLDAEAVVGPASTSSSAAQAAAPACRHRIAAMPAAPEVSAVVVTRNRAERLRNLLGSLAHLPG